MIVYRKPSAAFDEEVRSLAGRQVELRDAAHSQVELDGLRHRVEADLAQWHSRGVEVTTVATLPDGTAVRVGSPDVERVRSAFTEHYGPSAPLVFEPAAPALAD